MSRYSQHASSRPGAFAGCLVVVAILGVLPSRWTGWLSSISGFTQLVVAPVQAPVYHLARWVVPGRGTKVDDALVEGLKQERDRFQTLWLREQERTKELERRIAELQHGVILGDLPVRQIATSVIGQGSEGTGGDLLIRAGASQGVEINNVVTTGGVQIVGRVSRAGGRQSQVRLLTDTATGYVGGVVMNDDGTPGPICNLHPAKSGDELLGDVGTKNDAGKVKTGQLVRLLDDAWPRSARMLVIGEIVSAEDSVTLHQKIKVRPTRDLQRLSEVVVRTNIEGEEAGEPSAGGGKPGSGAPPDKNKPGGSR
jgi:cell shape-determining protein MreC